MMFLGHRLKSANNKTSRMFDALKTPRRIILSGTPIQNDLGEFHAMVRRYGLLASCELIMNSTRLNSATPDF